MTKVVVLPPIIEKARVGFRCALHDKYDLCLIDLSCAQHPIPNEVHTYRQCICEGRAWQDMKVSEPTCICNCHKNTRWSTQFSTCGRCCTEARAKISPEPPCECLCHSEFAVDCGTYNLCCFAAKHVGETDAIPRWKFENLAEYPWTMGVSYRRSGNKHMVEDIHLNMTVTGSPIAKDLFYVILAACDSDFPIKPMRKRGDKVPFCVKCNGLIWNKCCIGPVEILKAARQAADASHGELVVKVHQWQRSGKCGGTDVVMMDMVPSSAPPKLVCAAGGD